MQHIKENYTETKKVRKKPWYIIYQNNIYRVGWEIFISIIVVVIAVVIPWHLAFEDNFNMNAQPTGYVAFSSICDVFFFFDILLSFLTSYTDQNTQEEVVEPKLIVKNYLRDWFILDLISVVPIEYWL